MSKQNSVINLVVISEWLIKNGFFPATYDGEQITNLDKIKTMFGTCNGNCLGVLRVDPEVEEKKAFIGIIWIKNYDSYDGSFVIEIFGKKNDQLLRFIGWKFNDELKYKFCRYVLTYDDQRIEYQPSEVVDS